MNRAPLAIAIAVMLPISRAPLVMLSTWAFGYYVERAREFDAAQMRDQP